jgi:predicted  nucleic acid-binding Zn-ribbon protein
MTTISEQQHECIQCGTSFTSRNPNAQFCSDRCKQSAYHRRKQEESAESTAKNQQQPENPVSEQPKPYSNYRRDFFPEYDNDSYDTDQDSELTEEELYEQEQQKRYEQEQQKLPWWKRDLPKDKAHKPKSSYYSYEKDAIEQLDENITDWIGRIIKMSNREKAFFKHIENMIEEMKEYIDSYDYKYRVPKEYPLSGYIERAMIPRMKKFLVLSRANGGRYAELNLDESILKEFEEILMIAAE